MKKKTILITGAGGVIGTLLRESLADKYTIRPVELAPIPGVEETIVTTITNMDAMLAACQGVDSVIHLAASASPEASWNSVLYNNIDGTYTVFEAASQAGVKQVIYASSTHAVASYDLEHAPEIYRTGQPQVNHLVPVRPANLYGVSKCCGEALARYYADQRSMRVIVLRIGAINPADDPYYYADREDPERLGALYLSHRDCIQLFKLCLAADGVMFDTFYGVSDNATRFYDLRHPREVIGYEPQDDSSTYPRPRRQE